MPQLLAVFLRHSGHPGDDFDRERTGEVLHDVEVVGINRAEVFVGHLVHVIHLRLNSPRSEGLVEQAAHVTVVRRIHEDDGSHVLGEALAHHRQVAATGRRVGLEVLQRAGHVLVAGQRVEVLFLVVVERSVLPHSLIDVERVGEELLGERIKDDL